MRSMVDASREKSAAVLPRVESPLAGGLFQEGLSQSRSGQGEELRPEVIEFLILLTE